MRPAGVEPTTLGFGNQYSIHLSYGRIERVHSIALFALLPTGAVEDDNQHANPKDPDWRLGERQRHRGSLHQDIWEGTAADLASRGYLAVYPAMGWWRTRPKLERYDLPAHFSLIVSIRAPEIAIDLYSAVAAKVQTPVVITT